MEIFYRVKRIFFLGSSVPVLCQNENGPCPLLALVNSLLLTKRIQLPGDLEVADSQFLLNVLGDYLLKSYRLHDDPAIHVQQLDQINTAIQLLPKLLRGMVGQY